MNIKSAIYTIFLTGLFLPLLWNCKKEPSKVLPTIKLSTVTNITATTATCGGDITSDGGSTVALRGVCWSSTNPEPTTSDSKTNDGFYAGSFTSSLIGLTPGTTYTIRAYAINGAGRGYSSDTTFTTLTLMSVLTTTDLTSITSTSAISGGTITNDGGSPITARGICWSTNQNPTLTDANTSNGSGLGSFTSNLNGLVANTTYYVRAYAINSQGTSYGNEVSFMTTLAGSVTDIDGNVYNTVTIGTQVWMIENLKTTKYRNGDPISTEINDVIWSSLTTGAYCDYDNNVTKSTTYGRLYNWHAVIDSRNIAPVGWHVPTDAEWTTLTTFLGGESVAGGNLKETGTSHWVSPNTGATNSTGFLALPGGGRCYSTYSTFSNIGIDGYWWSSTAENANDAWDRNLSNLSATINRYNDGKKTSGFSVRCVKD